MLALNHKYAAAVGVSTKSVVSIRVIIGLGERAAKDEKRGRQLENFCCIRTIKTNEMHQFLKFIFGIELYMFRTVSLSIIRSLALYTQQ